MKSVVQNHSLKIKKKIFFITVFGKFSNNFSANLVSAIYERSIASTDPTTLFNYSLLETISFKKYMGTTDLVIRGLFIVTKNIFKKVYVLKLFLNN